MFHLLPDNTTATCPVCGYMTSLSICPYSQSGENNYKSKSHHETFDGMYSSAMSNPYWNFGSDEKSTGFRLGWNASELNTIFNSAISLCGPSTLSPNQPRLEGIANTVVLKTTQLWNLTEPEVFTLCSIGILKRTLFPGGNPQTMPDALAMFAKFKIPAEMYAEAIEVMAFARNLYSSRTWLTATDVARVKFKVGIIRLLYRWMIPGYCVDFDSANPSLQQIKIMPNVDTAGVPPISGLPAEPRDDLRRLRYEQIVLGSGAPGTPEYRAAYEQVFSHMYNFELSRTMSDSETTRLHRRQVWGDLMWFVENKSFDPDIFGISGFVFLPEDRLTRLLLLLCIAAVKGARDERLSLTFMHGYPHLFSAITPLVTIRSNDDIWVARPTEIWTRGHMSMNATRFGECVKRINQRSNMGNPYSMTDKECEEVFRRCCGYARDTVPSDSGPLDVREVSSLTGGYWPAKGSEPDRDAPMMNFQRLLAILAVYIGDPISIPFSSRPRYGLILCHACDKMYVAPPARRGCFDKITEKGMPIANPASGGYDVILDYACPVCANKNPGMSCRELTLNLNRKCPSCRSEDIPSFAEYSFEETQIKYTIRCSKCNRDFSMTEAYDNQSSYIMFGSIAPRDPIIEMPVPRTASHHHRIFKLFNPDDPTQYRTIEFLPNLKHGYEPRTDSDTIVQCPYELLESPSHATQVLPSYCQNMPPHWNVSNITSPSQVQILRKSKGYTHRTVKIGSVTEPDGSTRVRYVCLDHKRKASDILKNLAARPEQNMLIDNGRLKRGNEYLDNCRYMSQASFGDTPLSLANPSSLIGQKRLEVSLLLLDIPLKMAEPMLYGNAELDDYIRYGRRADDAKVAEVPYAPDGNPSVPLPPLFSLDTTGDGGIVKYPVGQESDDRPIAIDLRHMFTFEPTPLPPPQTRIRSCDEMCGDWERKELILSTLPFKEHMKKVVYTFTKKQTKKWQITDPLSHMVATKSMPFIPEVTPRKRVEVEWQLIKRVPEPHGLVFVHVDISGSMGEMSPTVGSVVCPHIRNPDDCNKCGGQGYHWTGGRCRKDLLRVDAAKRVMIAATLDAKYKKDSLMFYGFESKGYRLNPDDYLVRADDGHVYSKPCDRYDYLVSYLADNERIKGMGATWPSTTLKKMMADIEYNKAKSGFCLIVTDGEWHDADDASKLMARFLVNYGPVFVVGIFEESAGDEFKRKMDDLSRHNFQYTNEAGEIVSWNPAIHYPFEREYVTMENGRLDMGRLVRTVQDALSTSTKTGGQTALPTIKDDEEEDEDVVI